MRIFAFIGAILLSATAVTAHPGVFHEIAALTGEIAADPANPGLRVDRAVLERFARQYDEALADLSAARSMGLADPRIDLEAGLTLGAAGCVDEADTRLTRYLEAVPGGAAEAFVARARIRAAAGREDEAVVDYTAAAALAPDPDLYLDFGALLERMGRLDEAARLYRDGFDRLGGAVVLEAALVRVEVKLGNWTAALDRIDHQLAAAPVKTDAYLSRAVVHEAAGQLAAARADRERALAEADGAVRRSPTGLALYARARAQLALGNVDAAKDDLREALRRAPRYQAAQQLLAGLRAR